MLGIGAAILLGVHSLRFLYSAEFFRNWIGICYPVMGALIMAWFSKREQRTLHNFAAVTFLESAQECLSLSAISPVRWLMEAPLGSYGFSLLATALVWLVIGRNSQEVVSADETSAAGAAAKNPSSLSKALTMPVAWTLALGTLRSHGFTTCTFLSYPCFWKAGGVFR